MLLLCSFYMQANKKELTGGKMTKKKKQSTRQEYQSEKGVTNQRWPFEPDSINNSIFIEQRLVTLDK